MRIAGIIAEYDPFHNGHAAHIAATRSENGGNATHLVTVISGNFTQRGEPAMVSKFHRAQMALDCGADLVLELPLPWAMSPAESFAAGGVATLNALGCVEMLSFGSECGNIDTLHRLAELHSSSQYQTYLKEALDNGILYAAANQHAAEKAVGTEMASALSAPNNTLAIEYMRAITAQNATWNVFTLQRQGALHNDTTASGTFASASMLRDLLRQNNTASLGAYMPEDSANILKQALNNGRIATHTTRLEDALLARLRCMSQDDFSKLPWLSEGLENRLYHASRTAASYEDLLMAVKTRRYPMARLRRILWAALIGLTTDDVQGLPPYIRVLGMNERGREILAAACPSLPIITRATQIDALDDRSQRIFSLECIATDLHALSMESPQPCGTDFTTKLIRK